MRDRRLSTAALIAGVLCFLVGGGIVVARSMGAIGGWTESTTALAVIGLMLVAAGASMKRRSAS